MAYRDTFFSRADRYSIGVEDETGKHYVSIPVSNGVFDYEEYYELTVEEYVSFVENAGLAIAFAQSCRNRERRVRARRRFLGSDEERLSMTSLFSVEVEAIVGPVLAERGFVMDEVDDRPDAGGRERHVVYYRSNDCKVQVYQSSRDGEVNAMIAPADVPNHFGPQAEKWHYFSRFMHRPDLPLRELARMARAEYDAYSNPLEWVRDRILGTYDAAYTGIQEMYGAG
jgi:hypothetical protein